MKAGGKKKTQMLNDAVEAETTVENGGESKKRALGSEGDYGGGDDNEPKEEEEDDGDDEEDDEDEEEEEEDGEEEGAKEERPNLDEGYFEIEAIRRKRVRKGKLQYLIKWRGWPETANTWEPLANLRSCSDVIDAFEQSLRPGKPGRKRKRRSGGFHSQTRKKQTHLMSVLESPNNSSLFDLPVAANLDGLTRNGDQEGNITKVDNRVSESSRGAGIEDEEHDPALIKLKGHVSCNDTNADNSAGCSGGDDEPNGLLKGCSKEAGRGVRCTGAKRRKSGSVKRFKQDETASQNPDRDSTTLDSFAAIARLEIEYPDAMENDLSQKSKIEDLNITKILKTMSFAASVSDNVGDVLVTFMALRSDGKEVMVDNRFLKAHNPLLLIDFYEQHLKYNST